MRKIVAALLVLGFPALASSAMAGGTCTDPFCVLYSFTGGTTDGEFPEAGLTADGKQNLYGTTFGGFGEDGPVVRCSKSCGNVYSYSASAEQQAVSTVYSFSSADAQPNDGEFPSGELVLLPKDGAATDFYGTTEYGGGTSCGGLGCGTVFHVALNQSTPNIVAFCHHQAPICPNGLFPRAGLVEDGAGSFYGTALLGGMGAGWPCGSSFGGCGTIYEIPGTAKRPFSQPLALRYSFCSMPNCADGAVPYGRLLKGVLRKDRQALYGTTEFGGAYGHGTIFSFSLATGQLSTLYSFCSDSPACSKGAIPKAGLIEDRAGNLYGTTAYGGGTGCGELGCGVIFELSKKGSYTVLHPFTGSPDGADPEAQLAIDANGTLYGTTVHGGDGCTNAELAGCGMVFAQPTSGTAPEVILHSFGDVGTNGLHPAGALLLAGQFLYGATHGGGDPTCHCGVIFRLDAASAVAGRIKSYGGKAAVRDALGTR